MNHDKPDDWVIATGESHTIKEFLELAFQHVNLNYEDFIEVSEKYYRPNEVGYLLGDPKKAMNKLGWKPRTNFKELVTMMLENDIEIAKSEKILIEKGLLEPSWENYLIP